jgi:hypothetical protein
VHEVRLADRRPLGLGLSGGLDARHHVGSRLADPLQYAAAAWCSASVIRPRSALASSPRVVFGSAAMPSETG